MALNEWIINIAWSFWHGWFMYVYVLKISRYCIAQIFCVKVQLEMYWISEKELSDLHFVFHLHRHGYGTGKIKIYYVIFHWLLYFNQSVNTEVPVVLENWCSYLILDLWKIQPCFIKEIEENFPLLSFLTIFFLFLHPSISCYLILVKFCKFSFFSYWLWNNCPLDISALQRRRWKTDWLNFKPLSLLSLNLIWMSWYWKVSVHTYYILVYRFCLPLCSFINSIIIIFLDSWIPNLIVVYNYLLPDKSNIYNQEG